jgi:hypothetical protein
MGRRDDHRGRVAVIGLTGGGANDPERASLAALIPVEGTIFAIGAALVRVSTRRHVGSRAEGLLLGAAAVALFRVSDVAIKWLTQAAPGPLLGLPSPWTLTALIAGAGADRGSLPGGLRAVCERSPRGTGLIGQQGDGDVKEGRAPRTTRARRHEAAPGANHLLR